MTCKLRGKTRRQLLDHLSTYCIRDQCSDNLKHQKPGLPLKKITRIQSNDVAVTLQFGQRCVGHEYDHARIEGGHMTYSTPFYPEAFCQRDVHLWKSDSEMNPNTLMKNNAESISERSFALYLRGLSLTDFDPLLLQVFPR